MAVANTTRRTVRRVPKRARQLRTAVIGIAIVALSVTPNVAASTARPAPFGDDGPQLQALVGDPPELDATFGTGGKVMTNTGGNLATAVAIQSDGKIVVAGGGSGGAVVARYTSSGAPDPSFDDDGFANVDAGIADDGPPDRWQDCRRRGACTERLLLRSDDRPARQPMAPPTAVSIRTGSLRSGSARSTDVNAVAIQTDGKLLIGGGEPFKIARFTTTGALDSSFGTAGYATTGLDSISSTTDLVIQPDGKIVAVGFANGDFAVARFTTGGLLDTTFDGDGVAATDFGTASDGATAVALQGDGKLVVDRDRRLAVRCGEVHDVWSARWNVRWRRQSHDGDPRLQRLKRLRAPRRRGDPIRREDRPGRTGIRRVRQRVRHCPV